MLSPHCKEASDSFASVERHQQLPPWRPPELTPRLLRNRFELATGKTSPGFVLPTRVRALLHGSCRKPHHDSEDALVLGDRWLEARVAAGDAAGEEQVEWPSALVMSGDQIYADESEVLRRFVAGLPAVRRLFAHLPVAMVFDDHGVTDDWNLNREWEETAYAHPFSRRIIGNALLAYLVNQGWGNRPEAFEEPLNWFTRRRRMRVTPRKPEGTPSGRRLLNAGGIGLLELDEKGAPWRIRQIIGGGTLVDFVLREEESRWD